MKILLVAYYFPPIGGGGVQRSVKLVRYLPDNGIEAVVLAGEAWANERREPTDDSLLVEIPRGTPVYRPSVSRPSSPQIGSRFDRLFVRRSAFEQWWERSVFEMGLRAAREHGVSAILASLAPYCTLRAALRLGEHLRLPVLADLRDPWALDESRIYTTWIHRYLDERRMGRQLEAADMVVMNTPEALQAVRSRYPFLDADRCTVVTNGYDPADFQEAAGSRNDGKYRIVHAGFLMTEPGLAQRRLSSRLKNCLGGRILGTDFLARSHFYLVKALELMQERDPRSVRDLRVELVGRLSKVDRRCVEESAVARLFELPGYLAHREVVRRLTRANLLFLPLHAIRPGARARIVPGKCYEYLASGATILGALPAGDARDFVVQARAGIVVEPSDVAGIAGAIVTARRKWKRSARVLDESVCRFDRRRLTAKMAHIVKRTVQGSQRGRTLIDGALRLEASARVRDV